MMFTEDRKEGEGLVGLTREQLERRAERASERGEVKAFLRSTAFGMAAAGALAAFFAGIMKWGGDGGESVTNGLLVFAVALAGVMAYFGPTIIARARGHRNATAIALLNLLLGWTLIGWVAALIWAVYREKP